MPKRISPIQIETFTDLNDLERIVLDKRNKKMGDEKKGRRNRHYTKYSSSNTLTWILGEGRSES